MTNETELEALRARIAKLEEAAKPPKPFVPGPRIQFDPTEGASMPPSAMKAMADRLMDEADRLDRIELAERLAKAAVIERAAKGEGNDK